MKFPEKYRVEHPLKQELNCFKIPFRGRDLVVIASIWGKWQHVSVSLSNRCPNWDEMCFVKELFWEDEEECVQFHPKKSEYINAMPYCLHIWKPSDKVSESLRERIPDCLEWIENRDK